MPDTPLTGLHHSIHPPMAGLLVFIDQSLEYVELSSGTCVATLATVPRSRNYDTCGYVNPDMCQHVRQLSQQVKLDSYFY